MTEVVVDASALVGALGADQAGGVLRSRLTLATCHAPHLVDAEVGAALRRLEMTVLLPSLDMATALFTAHRLVDHRYAHSTVIAARAWSLRRQLSFYDAL